MCALNNVAREILQYSIWPVILNGFGMQKTSRGMAKGKVAADIWLVKGTLSIADFFSYPLGNVVKWEQRDV